MEEQKSDLPDLMEALNSVYNILNKDVTCKSDEVNLVLFLMKKLPPCREPALEVLKNVLRKCLDEMVRRNNNKDDPEIMNLAALVYEIEKTFFGLIASEPSFSFIIAEWSIERLILLGVETGLTGPLTNFAPVQLYINTLSKSLKNISKEQLQNCFDRLLNTPSNNAVHFEWIVAQISAAFPKEMIGRVLQFGLKDYYSNTSSPRLGRVASVLNHLVHSNALLVHQSLTDFLKESIESSSAEASQTALFFMHLSCQSTLLLRIFISIFFTLVDWPMLKQIITKGQSTARLNSQQLIDLMVAVLLNCDHMVVGLLDCLLCLACSDFGAFSENIKMNKKSEGKVKVESNETEVERNTSAFCCRLISSLSTRISSLTVNEMNLSNSLNNDLKSFSKLLKPPFSRQQLVFKLMRSFCHLYPTSSCLLLSLLLTRCSSNKDIAIFKELQTEVSHTNATIAHDVMATIVTTLEDQCQNTRFKIVSLLQQLFDVEENHVFQCVRLKSELDHFYCRLVNLIFLPSITYPTKSFHKKIDKHMKNSLTVDKVDDTTLSNEDTDKPGNIFYTYNNTLLQLIAFAEKDDMTFENQAELLYTSSITINLLFASLKHLDGTEKINMVSLVVGRLKWLCVHGSQQYFITTLFQEALSEKHDLFSKGCKSKKKFKEISSIVPLFTDTFNTHNLSSSELDAKSHGLLFHTGSIGNNEKNRLIKTKTLEGDKCSVEGVEDSTLLNKFLFLNAFQACCLSSNDSNEASMDGLIDKKVVEGLSDCVLDTCMPDALTSGVLWNQEETINYSRDLLVKKKFLDTELLRKMLDILSASVSGIWRCSALMRGLLGHMLTYWEACREGAEDKQQLQLTISVITLLTEGGLLPEPLSLVGELMEHVSDYEIFLLLFEVWTFLKENNPPPNSITKCDSKHIEAVRMIMINNIHKCGHLFPFFFK